MLLTALVNAHEEGRLLGAALRSVEIARRRASLNEPDFEVLVVLDRPDDLTVEVARHHSKPGTRVLVVDRGDAGLARNDGVEHARGRFVANLDADDVWGVSWLRFGLDAVRQETGDSIYHPQIAQYFGGDRTGWQAPSMSDPAFRVVSMLEANPWTSSVLAPISVFRQCPYRQTPPDHRFAYEDWSWNCDTVAQGLEHLTVPRTVHFVRRREVSLSRTSMRSSVLPIPHSLDLCRAIELDAQRLDLIGACS